MKHLLVILICATYISTTAQVTDITPIKGDDMRFWEMKSTNDSNLFVRQFGRYHLQLSYIDNKWNKIIAPPLSANNVNYYFLGKDIYANLAINGPAYSFYSKILRWNGKDWDSIGTASLNVMGGFVKSVMLDESDQLVAMGEFRNAQEKYSLARLVDSTWQPIILSIDDVTIRAIQYHNYWRRNKQGIFFFYTYAANALVSWDGKSLKRLGTLNKGLSSIAPASNGHVFAGISQLKPGGIMEWDGSEWKLIPCTLPSFDNSNLRAVTINDRDEVFAGGNVKKGSELLIMKYSNGTWQEFATVPGKMINELFYLKGKLYVITDEEHNILMLSTDNPGPIVVKPVGPKPTPVDYYHEQVWNIYTEFMVRRDGMSNTLSEITSDFENTDDETISKTIAARGQEAIKDMNSSLNNYKQRISSLNIMQGKNILVAPLLDYISAFQRYTASWNTMFSCYIKEDASCMEAVDKQLDSLADAADQKKEELKKTAELYKQRNGLE